MAKKFTDVQLSRILSHLDELTVGGVMRRNDNPGEELCVGCINQAAYNIGDSMDACAANSEVAGSFDMSYKKWTPGKMIEFLTKLGAL